MALAAATNWVRRYAAALIVTGVALSAIQGLNAKLAARDAEIAALKARLDKLEMQSH